MKKMTFKAEGIMCTGCAMDMQTVLEEKDGISDVSVSYMTGEIKVTFDPEVLDEKQVYVAVRKLGFKTQILSVS